MPGRRYRPRVIVLGDLVVDVAARPATTWTSTAGDRTLAPRDDPARPVDYRLRRLSLSRSGGFGSPTIRA